MINIAPKGFYRFRRPNGETITQNVITPTGLSYLTRSGGETTFEALPELHPLATDTQFVFSSGLTNLPDSYIAPEQFQLPPPPDQMIDGSFGVQYGIASALITATGPNDLIVDKIGLMRNSLIAGEFFQEDLLSYSVLDEPFIVEAGQAVTVEYMIEVPMSWMNFTPIAQVDNGSGMVTLSIRAATWKVTDGSGNWLLIVPCAPTHQPLLATHLTPDPLIDGATAYIGSNPLPEDAVMPLVIRHLNRRVVDDGNVSVIHQLTFSNTLWPEGDSNFVIPTGFGLFELQISRVGPILLDRIEIRFDLSNVGV